MTTNGDFIRSLYQVAEYPLELSPAICREYSHLKHGVLNSVEYFADMLTPEVAKIIASTPKYNNWVLSSPPSRSIPTAANLLSWNIYKRLNGQSTSERQISVVRLYNNREEGPIDENAREFSYFNGYSQYTWEERSEIIQKNKFAINANDFRDQGVIFINDINVTGASQEYISTVFSTVYPDRVNWLYIIDCDKTMGRNNPQLENELNNFSVKTVFDFAAILDREDIRHTAKCISKIIGYSDRELEQLLGMLNSSQKSKLLDTILTEDLYQGDIFKEKIDLLRMRCLEG